ncbi:MAG: Undecaprenyl phosphate-alpha-4-amino-4-deoxy-L-arabinose arabinosyl transferase [Syntrophorhabdus sp. PtaU1.Bin050]|nr:MAG: Undecaprenyl phosphate-alpha-4-amino-4-deoxy-L-arabinose arabinosyl transferase [Syntrophorhabdus sp. PtaU1.Bin050]
MLSGDPRTRKIIYLLIIVAASCLFFFYNLGNYSLKEPDEGRYAEIPREMVEQGDYVVPHLNYVRYFEKPPLLYWVTAASYRLFSINEWAFRLPNALAAFLCVIITYLFAARWLTFETAFFSALMLLSSFGFFAMAHIVTVDMFLTFLLLASLLSFYEFYRSEKPLFLLLFFTALALAILAKGPVAMVLMGATVVLFLLAEKRISFLKKMVSAKGLLLFFLIAAPWFVVICLKEKEFFQFFFIDQNILRFITTKHHRAGPVYYFLPVLFGGLFPWSIFLPRAVIRLWRTGELRLFFIWSAVVFGFFSISRSKLPPYILPMFPAASIILGHLFETEWRQHVRPNWEIIPCVAFFSCIALAGLLYGTGFLDNYLGAVPRIAILSRDLREFSLGGSGVSLAILAMLAFPRVRTFSSLFLILGGFSLSVVLGLMLHAHIIDRFNTTKQLAQVINQAKMSASCVVNYGSYNQTLSFYTQRRTYLVDDTGELEMGSRYQDSKGWFLNRDEFERLFQSGRQAWVVFKTKRPGRSRELGSDHGSVIG